MTAPTSPFKIAAAQYDVTYFQHWQHFKTKLSEWVTQAAQQQAKLLVFPEYAAMELCSLFPSAIQQDLHQQLDALQSLLPDYLELYQDLAQQHQVTIVAGSFPQKITHQGQARYVNRAYVLHPNGQHDYQDKQVMTRFENEAWAISPGTAIKAINTAVGHIGISICYDSEFPLIARRQMELGADFLIVPSVTETLSGYHRVKIGSQARALENQCYVIHAPLVGEANWSPAVDINTGCAGIYTPIDHGFPADGILAQGQLNQAQWVYATLDLNKARAIRHHGQVLNYQDWSKSAQRL